MAISNMPAAFQVAYQQNMLQRAFQGQLKATNILRAACMKTPIPTRSGESLIYSRAGKLVPVVQPSNPANNTLAFDLNASVPGVGAANNSYPIEQYRINILDRDQEIDINIIQDEQTLSSIYFQNWVNLVDQVNLSMDLMAFQQLSQAYESGNTWVTSVVTNSPTTVVAVDNILGFSTAFNTVAITNPNTAQSFNVASGEPQAVSTSNKIAVKIYPASGAATISANVQLAVADGTNSSTMISAGMINGVSGQLTFDAVLSLNVGDVIVAFDAPPVRRPRVRSRYALTTASTAPIQLFRNAKSDLKRNGVKPFADGTYLCILDDVMAAQLYTDPQFQIAAQGAIASEIFTNGTVVKLWGLTFVESTNLPSYAFTNVNGDNLVSHRAFVLGQGCIQEGTFEGMKSAYQAMSNSALSHVEIVDDYALITRPALDSRSQIWTQTWVWIGGHVCGTDATVTPVFVPQATASRYKRAVCIEVADVS